MNYEVWKVVPTFSERSFNLIVINLFKVVVINLFKVVLKYQDLSHFGIWYLVFFDIFGTNQNS